MPFCTSFQYEHAITLFEIRTSFGKLIFPYLYINFRPQGRVLQNSCALFSQFLSLFFFDSRLFLFSSLVQIVEKRPTFFQLAVSLCFCDLFSIDSLRFRARKNVSTFLFFWFSPRGTPWALASACSIGSARLAQPLCEMRIWTPYYGAYENRYEMKSVFLISSFMFKSI